MGKEVVSREDAGRYAWPRYEDGTPVTIGDAIEVPGMPGVGMWVEAIEVNRDGAWVKDAPDGDFDMAIPASHVLRRPLPLERDGSEGGQDDGCAMGYDPVHGDYVCRARRPFVRTDASRRWDGSASLKFCPNCGRALAR